MKKKYDVDVQVNYTFTVEANSEEEAQEIAGNKYYESSDVGEVISSTVVSTYN